MDKLLKFLKHRFPKGVQTFFSRNIAGDKMTTIYDEDGYIVDACYDYGYIEIFGVSIKEAKSLIKEGFYEMGLLIGEYDED